MATSYSTNLALTLQGTNDNPGTWGDITNTNLGTLLEQAISGYETQALTSGTTLTLTIPNGSTGVARNMYLEFTGNGSTVIVPSNKKLYFVYNNCTSGTITMKVAGQTGISIPQGDKKILVSNGTDVIEATTYISSGGGSLTLTNLSVTSLTVSNNASINSVLVGKGTGSGTENTAVGANAGDSMTTGAANTVFGNNAGTAITTGGSNTCIGASAGLAITTANWNTLVGHQAGDSVTTGPANTLVGYQAGTNISTGSTNAALGDSAFLTGNFSNSTCLGYDSVVTGSNQVQLGNSGTTAYAYGAVVDRASDIRDKADVQNTNLGLNFIMALRPVMYRWDYREDYRPPKPGPDATKEEWDAYNEACKLENLTHDGSKKRNRLHQGLIAQEVKAVMDNLGTDFGGYKDGTIDGGEDRVTLAYGEFIAPLIKAIQELKAEFDEYKRTHP
jgi:hypothetical protein